MRENDGNGQKRDDMQLLRGRGKALLDSGLGSSRALFPITCPFWWEVGWGAGGQFPAPNHFSLVFASRARKWVHLSRTSPL